jgi:hypothetical protein
MPKKPLAHRLSARLVRSTAWPASAEEDDAKATGRLLIRSGALWLLGWTLLALAGLAASGLLTASALVFEIALVCLFALWLSAPVLAAQASARLLSALFLFGSAVVALLAAPRSVADAFLFYFLIPFVVAEAAAFVPVALGRAQAARWAIFALPGVVLALTFFFPFPAGMPADETLAGGIGLHLCALFLFAHARYAEGVIAHRHGRDQALSAALTRLTEMMRGLWLVTLSLFLGEAEEKEWESS